MKKAKDNEAPRGRLEAVGDVELESPPGIEAELDWCYSQLIGLPRESDPNSGESENMLRFVSDRIELRIRIVDAPDIDAVDCRAFFAVPDLDQAADQLRERKMPFEWHHGLSATDRALFFRDPAGNRICLRRLWPSRTM